MLFNITTHQYGKTKVFEVSGVISVGGKYASERYSRFFKYRKDAEANAVSWERTEVAAREWIAEFNLRRMGRALAYLQQRSQRVAAQLELF